MTSMRIRAARPVAMLATLLVLATLVTGASAAERRAGPVKLLIAGPAGPPTYVREEAAPASPAQHRAATIIVTYHGFPAAAQASFQRAVNIWKNLLTTSVPITIDATYTDLGNPNILGSAGPGSLWRNFTGAPRPNTWYADGPANKAFGGQLNAGPDVIARLNNTFPNWHFGSAPAPAGKYDFESVVLHEIGHGIGFLGFGRVTGSLGSVKSGTPANPSIYDVFTENGAGTRLTTFANNSVVLGNVLQGNNIFYDSARVRAAFGNKRAKLFAPNPFQQGSSYSHLDEATFPAGNPNSLMTPQLGQGETIRAAGPITRAILKDEGW